MVDMGMGEQHGIDACRIDRQRSPVAQAQLLEALEQAAIHQQPRAAELKQIFRAGDGTDAAEESELCGQGPPP
jgi:hypothetical protein